MTRLEQLQKLVAVAPQDPMSHYGLGLEFINLQRWADAAAAFSQAIAVDGKYSAAFYHKARAEIGGGQHDAARATLEAGMGTARAAGDWHTEGEMRELLESIG
jgi:tetratricopeptide (TPR) repeat protein